MGNCTSDPTYQQFEVIFFQNFQKFVTKGLNRALTQRSIRIQNQFFSIKGADENEKLIKLVLISLKQNRYFYDQLQDIFGKFGSILPQKFMIVQNSYSQELKQLLKTFQQQNFQNKVKQTQKIEEIKILQERISFLQNLRTQKQDPKVEMNQRNVQEIDRLNRIILKHQKNTQNDKKLIHELKVQIQGTKRLQKQNQDLQIFTNQLKTKIQQLNSQIQQIKIENNHLTQENKVIKSKQIQPNPQMHQNEQQDEQKKYIQVLKKQLDEKSQYLQQFQKQLILREQNCLNIELLKEEHEKQICQKDTYITILENNIKKLQQAVSFAKEIENELTLKLREKQEIISKMQQKERIQQEDENVQTPNGESVENNSVNDNNLGDKNVENYQKIQSTHKFKITDQNQAVVHQILTKKLTFTPWKGFLNKFAFDLGLTMNGALTHNLYRKNPCQIKKQTSTYKEFF